VIDNERIDGLVIDISVDGNGTGTATLTSAGTILSDSTTQYDALGRAYQTTSATGVATTTEFDAAGNAIQTTQVVPQTTVSPLATYITSTEYDAAGRAVASTDALGQTTRTVYDADGRAIQTIYADGSSAQTHYDSDGRKNYEIDAVGQRTDYGYDALGRLATITQPGVVNPATGQTVRPVTTYGYDNYGNQTSITDANGHVTQFAFDQFGRLTGRTLPAVDGESASESTTYDSFGNVDTSTDFDGNETVYIYDYDQVGVAPLGRLMETDYFTPAGGDPAETETYSYDSLGRRQSVIDSVDGTVRETDYQYDLDGHATQVSSPEGTINYQYDAATGEQMKMFTDSTEVDYAYDPLGRLVQVKEVKRAGETLTDPVVTAYAYDPVGNLSSQTTTQGGAALASTTNSYDPQTHLLTSVVNTDGASNTLSSFGYAPRRWPDHRRSRIDRATGRLDDSHDDGLQL